MLTQGTRHCNLEPAKGRETGLFFRPSRNGTETPVPLAAGRDRVQGTGNQDAGTRRGKAQIGALKGIIPRSSG
jgi:hypothetical protein